MDTCPKSCDECVERMICHCLQVTETEVIEALATREVRTLKDLRRHTAAGDGCTACHRQLMELLQAHRRELPVCANVA